MTDYLEISHEVFAKMESFDWFSRFLQAQYADVCRKAGISCKLLSHRLLDAHEHWQTDLKRVSQFELNNKTPDHFKQSGHLVYWLRRTSPVIEFINPKHNISDAEGLPPTEAEKKLQELLFKYGNEYLAFDVGYRLCRYYETERNDGPLGDKDRLLTPDYILTISHFLKTKNVSPHAMFLILKSLFLR